MAQEPKFKPGDVVVQTVESTNYWNRPGEHVVRRCIPAAVYFEGSNDYLGYCPNRFELVDKEPVDYSVKDTNPKDAVGTKKPPMSTVSGPVLQEVGVAMLEGAMKYGRHNYRIAGVRSSVYYDAALRHLIAYWEGEDIDPDSGVSHLSKAIAGLAVLRDSEINKNVVDDRPPRMDLTEHKANIQRLVDDLFEKYPDRADAYTEVDR